LNAQREAKLREELRRKEAENTALREQLKKYQQEPQQETRKVLHIQYLSCHIVKLD